eukprot:1090646-Heterocapsa_arctica.AAC.1
MRLRQIRMHSLWVTWPAARKANLTGEGTKAAECPHCKAEGRSIPETAIHRWWICPRWEVFRHPPNEESFNHLGTRHNYHPRCLWECGLLPLPAPSDMPGKAPCMDEASTGEPT